MLLPSRKIIFAAAAFGASSGLSQARAAGGFGETPAQCETEYGKPHAVTIKPTFVCPQTLGYDKEGLSIVVGFDETGKAEEFVYFKAAKGKAPNLTEAEQKTLLDQFKEGGVWTAMADNGNGPIWARSDGQAFASYLADNHWLVITNKHCMDRFIKNLHERSGR